MNTFAEAFSKWPEGGQFAFVAIMVVVGFIFLFAVAGWIESLAKLAADTIRQPRPKTPEELRYQHELAIEQERTKRIQAAIALFDSYEEMGVDEWDALTRLIGKVADDDPEASRDALYQIEKARGKTA